MGDRIEIMPFHEAHLVPSYVCRLTELLPVPELAIDLITDVVSTLLYEEHLLHHVLLHCDHLAPWVKSDLQVLHDLNHEIGVHVVVFDCQEWEG